MKTTPARMRLAIACLTGAALQSGLSAQAGMSGAPSVTATATSITALGGTSQSPSWTAEIGGGQVATALEASSAGFRLEGGVVWALFQPSPGPPVVFGTQPGAGPKAGGQSVEIIGFNFDAPGSSIVSASICGVPTGPISPVSNTQLSVVTSPGTSPVGNPLGPCPVLVFGTKGLGLVECGYSYLPALKHLPPTSVGGELNLLLSTGSVNLYSLALASCSTGFAIPVPPFDGALELFGKLVFPVKLGLVASGAKEHSFSVPNDPGLGGLCVDFQALVITDLDPAGGEFTNKVPVVIQP